MALVALLVLSPVAGVLVASTTAVAAPANPGNGQGGPPDEPGNGNGEAGGGPPPWAGPPGHAGVPESKVDVRGPPDGVPADPAAWHVGATEGTDTLETTIETTADGQLRIVLTDDTNPSGREVSLNATAVEEALGYRPERVYGRNEDDGERWTAPASYENDALVFTVPHFSTNTITFSGEVSVSGDYADGSTVSYQIDDLDSASDPTINLTGSLGTETDTESGTISLGGSSSVSIAGSQDPTGPSSTSEPEVTVEPAHGAIDKFDHSESSATTGLYYDHDGSSSSAEALVASDLDDVGVADRVCVWWGSTVEPMTVDIRIAAEDVDGTYGEGTLVKDNYGIDSAQENTVDCIPLDTTYDTSGDAQVAVELVVVDGGGSGSDSLVELEYDSGPSTDRASYGGTLYGRSWGVELRDSPYPSNVDVSTSSATASVGSLDPESSVTKDLDLSTSDTDLSASGSGGPITYDLTYVERQETIDPSVSVNGVTAASYTGTLSDGTTQTYTGSSSDLQTGTNYVNVSLSSASADAPEPTVNLEYSHDATDDQVVSYEAKKWSEEYNVSKTFADATANANLTIPFADEVVAVKRLEKSVNGGTYQSVSASNYDLSGTTLEVDLGSVSSGDNVSVRTTGRRVSVSGGSITVTEPTTMGNRLDSRIRLDSWGDGAYIAVGNSVDGTRIHYAYDAGGSNEYTTIDSSGTQQLYLPTQSDGAELQVSTIPVKVVPGTGDAKLSVPNPSTTEPAFEVEPGSSSGDPVEFTFVDANDGQRYILYSKTRGVVRDSGTASSPLTLEDDDSDETLVFQLDEGDDSSSSDGGVVGGPVGPTGSGPLNSVPAILIAYTVVLIVLYIVDRGGGFAVPNPVPSIVPVVGGDRVRVPLPGSKGPLFWGGATLATLVVLEFLSSGLISRTIFRSITDLVGSLQEVVPLAGIVAIGLTAWFLYRRFIKGEQTRDIVIRSDGGK